MADGRTGVSGVRIMLKRLLATEGEGSGARTDAGNGGGVTSDACGRLLTLFTRMVNMCILGATVLEKRVTCL